MGLFNLYTDQSPYSATEALVLFELSVRKQCTAAYLSNLFHLDKGYISRLLKHLERDGLVVKRTSEEDRRFQQIEMTELGRDTLNSLAEKASLNVQSMIEGISDREIDVVINSMKKIEYILTSNYLKGGFSL